MRWSAVIATIVLLGSSPAGAQFAPGANAGMISSASGEYRVLSIVGAPVAAAAMSQVRQQVAIRRVIEAAPYSFDLPEQLVLASSYPNPTRGRANIEFGLPADLAVKLSVYDMLGRRVAILVDEQLSGGSHRRSFDLRSLPSGLYLIRLQGGASIATGYLTLLK